MSCLHPLIRLFVAALFVGAVLAGCDGVDSLSPSGGGTPISFATTVAPLPGADGGASTRAGDLTTSNLTSMAVFASYTGSDNWTTSGTCNFIHNQEVKRTDSSTPWTYAPMKYWPGTTGEKLSFFAYAPHSSSVTGLTATGNAATGYPVLSYTVPLAATSQTDLLMGTPLADKQKGAALTFAMNHVLTRVWVQAFCTESITLKSVQLNEGRQTGKLTLNGSNAAWSNIATSADFTYPTATAVPANVVTRVAEFFLLPVNAQSITVTYEYDGSEETKSVDLPATLTWTQGKMIAYTLNIEVKSEITVTSSVCSEWADGGNVDITSTI